MKIWTLFASVLFGATILGCSTSNTSLQEGGRELSLTNYQVLVSGGSGFYAQNIVSDSDGLSVTNSPNIFPGGTTASLEFRASSKITFYHKTDTCGGTVLFYDFEDGLEFELPVFLDLSSCTLTVTAVTQQDDMVFLSYYLDRSGKNQAFFVRSININTKNFTDFELNQKPTQLAVSNSRLFVLTRDESQTSAYALKIIDIEINTKIHEIDLGLDVGTIFTKTNGDIIISYPNAHTTLDSNSLNPSYTRYNSGSEPHFYNAQHIIFDESGRMYYIRNTALDSETDGITATHDFNSNSTVLYYFENFLNEAQFKVEFDIETTTTLNYDDVNDLILIGYKKNTTSGGGIIRITPAPNLTFVDNLDLEDIPAHIFQN
ncbi:hypothetical protein [Maribacter antarcticus]|uniref:hypothetical protein n=1 Tax=Maribacter antarcticus TaxID=505250 RepID=UPI00047D1BD2|nr:hypothetical protein [Maribacter antarcticus]